MRDTDAIMQAAGPVYHRTETMYMPVKIGRPVEAMTSEQLRRGLCYKSGGDLEVCRACPGQKCRVARILLEREVTA